MWFKVTTPAKWNRLQQLHAFQNKRRNQWIVSNETWISVFWQNLHISKDKFRATYSVIMSNNPRKSH